MGEAHVRTLVIDDLRGGDRCLRVTWHSRSKTVVFSHWAGPVCTASTPVKLPEASRLVDLLVVALRDVASAASEQAVAGGAGANSGDRADSRDGRRAALTSTLTGLRTRLARGALPPAAKVASLYGQVRAQVRRAAEG